MFLDTLDFWQRIHRGCGDETSGPAGGREGPLHCGKGITFNMHIPSIVLGHLKPCIEDLN